MDHVQWEYRRRVANLLNEEGILRDMGEQGWELCGVWLFLLYFKRPRGWTQPS